MANEFQQKLDRFSALYTDGTLPMNSRHALELATDLHDLISVLTGRITVLEDQIRRLAPEYHEPRG